MTFKSSAALSHVNLTGKCKSQIWSSPPPTGKEPSVRGLPLVSTLLLSTTCSPCSVRIFLPHRQELFGACHLDLVRESDLFGTVMWRNGLRNPRPLEKRAKTRPLSRCEDGLKLRFWQGGRGAGSAGRPSLEVTRLSVGRVLVPCLRGSLLTDKLQQQVCGL